MVLTAQVRVALVLLLLLLLLDLSLKYQGVHIVLTAQVDCVYAFRTHVCIYIDTIGSSAEP